MQKQSQHMEALRCPTLLFIYLVAHMTSDVQNYVMKSACALKGMQLQIKLCQQVKLKHKHKQKSSEFNLDLTN